MKKIFFAMGALVAMSSASSVEAQCCVPRCGCDNWYIGGFGGLNWVTRKNHNSGSDHKYKSGYIVGGNVGYRWESGFHLEGEVSYRNNQNKAGHKAKQSTAFMANGLYQFDIDCFPIDIFFGGGVGWVNTQHHHHNSSDDSSSSNHNKNNGFAWQLIAGIAYPICENVDLNLEYRFFDESKSKFNNSSVDLGLKYYF